MDLIKTTPDSEKARNILNMVSLIGERIKLQDPERMAALIIADYYEIIKELVTAILSVRGYKTLSHKDLFDYLSQEFTEFSQNEISLLDDLRILRNRIAYDGFKTDPSYLKRKESSFKEIIKKLVKILEKGLEK